MTPMSDGEFSDLYREHYPAVLRFVRRRAHPDSIDDIVADTFVAAWKRKAEFGRAPLPWLYLTARNTMLNASRSSHRQTALAVRIRSEFDESAATSGIDAVEHRHDLVAAWQRLEAHEQEVLSLRIWEDLSAADAAGALGISRAGYSMRLSRARKRLATFLESDQRAAAPPLSARLASPLLPAERKR